jgi:hypothetical protein
MSRRQQDPLRGVSAEEQHELRRLSRSRSGPAGVVARATALLAVAAAHTAGRRSGDGVAHLVSRFN